MKKQRSKNTGGTIDIETYPGTYRTFAENMYETSLMKEVQPVKCASFSYKPYGKGKCYTRGEWQYPTYKAFVTDMHRVFTENDFLIGHNAKKFDLRQSNSFFAQFGLPKTNTRIEDTYTITKRHFKLASYKLKYVLVYFGIGYKIETGGEALWFATEKGDPKAQKQFLTYNENDTVQTEKLYQFLVDGGWATLPEPKFYIPGMGCTRCGAEDTHSRGEQPRAGGWVNAYMCKQCGKRLYTDVVKPYAVV